MTHDDPDATPALACVDPEEASAKERASDAAQGATAGVVATKTVASGTVRTLHKKKSSFGLRNAFQQDEAIAAQSASESAAV